MRPQLTNFVLGLVIYTFDDLPKRGRVVANLFRLFNRHFPDLVLQVFRAKLIDTADGKSDSFQNLDWNAFCAELESANVAKFQAQDHLKLREATIVLRANLNESFLNPERPNFILLSLSASYAMARAQETREGLLAFGKEAFDWLNAVYGYSSVGMLVDSNEDSDLPSPNFALPIVDFSKLDADSSIREMAHGVFWANLLGRQQVDRLGGIEKIVESAVGIKTDKMNRGGALLVASPNPFAAAGEIDRNTLASLFSLLAGASQTKAETKKSQRQDIADNRYRKVGFERMKAHVRKFDDDYLKINKVPRNHVWRPYRFCSQDVVLGLTVVKHSVDLNCLEVDVCMASDIPEFEPCSGAKVVASFLLSEAYKCGGTMEIRFSDYVEEGQVPQALRELAKTYEVTLEHADEGRITPSEARDLYVAITEYSPQLQENIRELADQGRLSLERACFAVHHGLWTRSELESIILGSVSPDTILGGDALPEQRHLYHNDILYARAAVMGGILDRKLLKRDRIDGNGTLELEDDVRPMEISFDKDHFAKAYICGEEISMPWNADQQKESSVLAVEQQAIVLIRARDRDELIVHFDDDLEQANQLASAVGRSANRKVFVLVPRDFEDLPAEKQDYYVRVARTDKLGILICPETTVALDIDAARRIASGRIIRE